MNSLKELYFEELRDLYSAESQLIKALPKMEKAASASELKEAFRNHLDQTRMHVERLDGIFKAHGEKSSGKECAGMKGLIKEGDELMKEDADPVVMDAALIGAAQRIEHYEIAAYGTVRTFASKLGFTDDKQVLQQTLDEEGAADHLLTTIAQGKASETGVNEQAMANGASSRSSASGAKSSASKSASSASSRAKASRS